MTAISKTLIALSAAGFVAVTVLANPVSAMERDHVVFIDGQIAAVSSPDAMTMSNSGDLSKPDNGLIYRDR